MLVVALGTHSADKHARLVTYRGRRSLSHLNIWTACAMLTKMAVTGTA